MPLSPHYTQGNIRCTFSITVFSSQTMSTSPTSDVSPHNHLYGTYCIGTWQKGCVCQPGAGACPEISILSLQIRMLPFERNALGVRKIGRKLCPDSLYCMLDCAMDCTTGCVPSWITVMELLPGYDFCLFQLLMQVRVMQVYLCNRILSIVFGFLGCRLKIQHATYLYKTIILWVDGDQSVQA